MNLIRTAIERPSAVIAIVLMVVLLVKPAGLFGTAAVERV